MNKKYITFFLLNVVLTLHLSAQEDSMGDLLLEGNKMVSVIAVCLIILLGIGFFLFRMDRKIKKLEDRES